MDRSSLKTVLLFITACTLGFSLNHFLNTQELSKKEDQQTAPQYTGEPQAYQLLFDSVTNLTSEGKCENKNWKDLPFIISPGQYCINNQQFTLTQGLVRFYQLGVYNQSHLINDGKLIHILSALSWITAHGSKDENKTPDELLSAAIKQKLSLRCNYVTDFSRRILHQLGYQTRLVRLYSFKPDQESGNQSHITFEVQDKNGVWLLADISGNHVFKNKQQLWMNALDMTDAVNHHFNQIEFVSLASDPKFDATGFIDAHFNYTFFIERIYASNQQLMQWYQDVFEAVLIQDPQTGIFYHPTDNDLETQKYQRFTQDPRFKIIGLSRNALNEKLYLNQ